MLQSLSVDFSWRANDLFSVLPISLGLICFVVYWFTSHSSRIKNYYYTKYKFDKAAYKHIFFTKISGFFILGVIPGGICVLFLPSVSLADYGLTLIPTTTLFSFVSFLALLVIVFPIIYISAKNPKNFSNYPQIRSKIWNKKILSIDAIGWVLYLLGYEFLFRGILLFSLVGAIGVWPAISINIALYSATHIPKGLDETIAAIPIGIVFCVLTLLSGTIWIAFFVHVAIALINSFTALKYNPATNFIKS